MIRVKRLNNEEFVVNAELISYIEKTPDTVITLTTGQKIVVQESVNEIIDKVLEYKWKIKNFKDIDNHQRNEV